MLTGYIFFRDISYPIKYPFFIIIINVFDFISRLMIINISILFFLMRMSFLIEWAIYNCICNCVFFFFFFNFV